MLFFTANDAKTRSGELLDRVQREPVQVVCRNRVVGVMVSPEDYEAMGAFHADRLQRKMLQTASDAAALGLNQAELEKLLADESSGN